MNCAEREVVMYKKYLSHTKDGKNFVNEDECQELKEHLIETAKLAL